jgi:DNA (cytosine-5)-methyltransferase 1
MKSKKNSPKKKQTRSTQKKGASRRGNSFERKVKSKSQTYTTKQKSLASAARFNEEAAAYFTATSEPFHFLEFFAGGGMARAGLSPQWTSVWANDFSASKAFIYQKNWGLGELHVGDVAQVEGDSLPSAHMIWGSFPCQDLSQAGNRSGIGNKHDVTHTRSGSFWPFWKLVAQKRPPIVVLENVEGALRANEGADIRALCSALSESRYRYGPMILDSVHWLPQSRKRLFIIAIREDLPIPKHLNGCGPDHFCHPQSVLDTYSSLPEEAQARWIWWSLGRPTTIRVSVESIIGDADQWVDWDSPAKTAYILSLMNPLHQKKVHWAQQLNRRIIGFAYRRTRAGRQRAEVRFDGIAGCLRTAGGGSSKQIIVEVHGATVRTRLLSPREAARLQGLPDTYWLPNDYNEAYDLVGDGLSVPVVTFLGEQLLTPLASVIPVKLLATA